MTIKVSAIFIDPRRDFSQQFTDLQPSEIQFANCGRAGRIAEAFQLFRKETFHLCVISDLIEEPLDSFFADIKKLEHETHCLYVRVITKAQGGQSHPCATDIEPGIDLVMHMPPRKEESEKFENMLKIVWRKAELYRRTGDIDSAVQLCLRLVDESAAQHRRGREYSAHHGATTLMQTHIEFDRGMLDEFVHRLSSASEKSEPVRKRLNKIPLPLLNRQLPGLSENGYGGASNRVFRSLLDRLGDSVDCEQAAVAPTAFGEPPGDHENSEDKS